MPPSAASDSGIHGAGAGVPGDPYRGPWGPERAAGPWRTGPPRWATLWLPVIVSFLVQVMPFPVIAHLTAPERRNLGRFVASGFVRTRSDVTDAIASGAMGVTTTTVDLWTLRRSEVGEQA